MAMERSIHGRQPDRPGGLLVADDAGNTVWRVSAGGR